MCCQTLDCCIRRGVTWWNLLVPLDGFGNKKENPKVFGNTCRILGWELEEWWGFFGRSLQFRGWFSGFHFKLGKVDVCDVSDVDSHGCPFVVLNRRLSGQLAVYNFEGGPCLRCAAWLQGRWSKQNSMATRLVLLAPSEVRPSFLWCQLHQLNSFSNFRTKTKMEWFGPFEPCCSGLHSKSPRGNQALLLEVELIIWFLGCMRSFQFSHRQQMPNLWPPVKSMVCLGPLWALWVHWPPWKPSRCVKLTVVVLKISGVKRFKMKDEQKVLDIFFGASCFFFFSRDFWMISWSWSWCQVLVKDSALHKSCLRGKLLLFDPTSSLHPCRTVRIKRPELQFSFCWFLVFDLSILSCFANWFWNPSNVLWIPLDFRISTSLFSSQPVISSA